MRAAAMSVWVFINLVFFGMCGYLYLIWSQYWMYIEKQRLFNKTPESSPKDIINEGNYHNSREADKFIQSYILTINESMSDSLRKSRRSAVGGLWSIDKSSSNNAEVPHRSSTNIVRKSQGSPRFPNVHKPLLEFDTEKYVCDNFESNECEMRTRQFKELLLKEFHRVLMGEGKVFTSGLDSQNTYNVQYAGKHRKLRSKKEVACALKMVQVKTVTSEDEPFKSLRYKMPKRPLRERHFYDTCAIVTSAGALLGSHFGEFIDSHDMVLRFNNAPTENYTEDVGSKTTFRVLNSQVVAKPEFNFLEDPLYDKVSILIWDPANYSSSIKEWYQHPDFPFFPVYKAYLDKKPHADVHLLIPRVLWNLWAVLQDSSPYRLRRNPPSSGFLGLWFSLHQCKLIRVFEYVPSARASRRCHYYSPVDDTGCTLGAWHPLAQEKALAHMLAHNSDVQVFQRGFIEIPGLSTLNC